MQRMSDAIAKVTRLDPEEEQGRVVGAEGSQESPRPVHTAWKSDLDACEGTEPL